MTCPTPRDLRVHRDLAQPPAVDMPDLPAQVGLHRRRPSRFRCRWGSPVPPACTADTSRTVGLAPRSGPWYDAGQRRRNCLSLAQLVHRPSGSAWTRTVRLHQRGHRRPRITNRETNPLDQQSVAFRVTRPRRSRNASRSALTTHRPHHTRIARAKSRCCESPMKSIRCELARFADLIGLDRGPADPGACTSSHDPWARNSHRANAPRYDGTVTIRINSTAHAAH